MKRYIVDVDIEWDLRWEERLNPYLPTTLCEYEVEAKDDKDLATQIVRQLEEEYSESINGCAYDILEVLELC